MSSIETIRLAIEGFGPDGASSTVDALWDEFAFRTRQWADERGIAARDLVVLLPFAQLLSSARRAWARAGGWPARIETTQTLAASRGPPALVEPGQITFDTALDALTAAKLLRQQAWAQQQSRRDPRGFDAALSQMVAAAQALARAAEQLPPDQRTTHWQRARAVLLPGSGPGAMETMLARAALEWAALNPPPITDRLFDLRPGAWVVMQAGGPDRLTQQLLQCAVVPALVFDADAAAGVLSPSPDHRSAGAHVELAVCESFEDEAQAAAAKVLAHLRDGVHPVALIAQDRALVRRARALLARQAVPLLDETGWKLSTTRAAAVVMSLLRAARPQAMTDDVLDALKASHHAEHGGALRELEAALRRHDRASRDAVDVAGLGDVPAQLWRDTVAALSAMTEGGHSTTLPRWIARLRLLLQTFGAIEPLQADPAGQQVLDVLQLTEGPTTAWPDTPSAFEEFAHWVDATLEQAAFVPPVPSSEAPVVITPLARALLRPFQAVVLPGCDEKRLGAHPAPVPLLSDAMAIALGLPGAAAQRDAERLALWQLLRIPRVTLLRRRRDGDEPLAASSLLERLGMTWRQHTGTELPNWKDPREQQPVALATASRPAPVPDRLPSRLSASRVEALRACPYQFFSRTVLGLDEVEELEEDLEKRDYGNWLHAVLQRFHVDRSTRLPRSEGEDTAALQALAEDERRRRGLDDASFMPFAVSFEHFVGLYLPWLHQREASGTVWTDGEVELTLPLPDLRLHGRIDRIDRFQTADARRGTELIDYKTGNKAGLNTRVRDPFEDTQLAFYAALVMARPGLHEDDPLRAIYLAVDDAKGIVEIEHRDVRTSARALVTGLSGELRRLRDGAGLPALGEGDACEHCEARGLCRRDDWASHDLLPFREAGANGATGDAV